MGSATTEINADCTYEKLTAQAATAPDGLAILGLERRPLSYRGLLSQMHGVRVTLNKLGIGRHDRLVMVLDNGPEAAVAFITISSCVTCVPLNPQLSVDEFEFYISQVNAKALIVNSENRSAARDVALRLGLFIIELIPELEAEAGTFSLAGGRNIVPVESGFANADDLALILHTSGTTSLPKLVPLTHRNICSMALTNQLFLQLGTEDLCLNVMPLFHSTGLIGVTLSSLLSGAGVVCPPGFYAPKFLEWLVEFSPTWYTAVPNMHQAILARAVERREMVAKNRLRFIRSSSSALPRTVMQGLEETFNCPVIESYGLTECGMIACNPLPPRERKAGSVGVATLVDLAIMDERGALQAPHSSGEVVVRGECVMKGYEKANSANQECFTDSWFKTGDQGFLDNEGYLYLTGRLKEIINRGGEKISPREIDEVLLAHPAVEQAVTFPVANESLGEEVAAAVVLRSAAIADEKELRDFVAKRLAYFKVPRQILVLDDIPKSPFGKIQRAALAQLLGVESRDQQAPKDRAEFVSPRTWEESVLVEIWRSILGVDTIGIRDDFFALGGDSILATQVVSQVRKILRVDLSPVTLFEAPTIADLAQSIERGRKKVAESAIPSIKAIPRA